MLLKPRSDERRALQPFAQILVGGAHAGGGLTGVVARRASVGPATVNRELATLRRMLRLRSPNIAHRQA